MESSIHLKRRIAILLITVVLAAVMSCKKTTTNPNNLEDNTFSLDGQVFKATAVNPSGVPNGISVQYIVKSKSGPFNDVRSVKIGFGGPKNKVPASGTYEIVDDASWDNSGVFKTEMYASSSIFNGTSFDDKLFNVDLIPIQTVTFTSGSDKKINVKFANIKCNGGKSTISGNVTCQWY